MTEALGYSVRQLAQKIGKDKGYVENRLRLTDAPPEVRELVALRKDTISHAYELMKVSDERTRRRLAKRVAAGELTLAKLRRITGSRSRRRRQSSAEATPRARTVAGAGGRDEAADDALMDLGPELADGGRRAGRHPSPARDDRPDPGHQPGNLAKHLTITKLKIENAIAIVRATRRIGRPRRPSAAGQAT